MITAGLLCAPSHVPLPAPGPLLDRRALLARRVADRVGADGLVTAPCESRVLESALLLALVTGLTPHAPARDWLVQYLKHALDTGAPDPIQVAVARAALGEAVAGDEHAERALGCFAHFTAVRKRLMFQTLLAELGAAPWPEVPLEAYDTGGQQSWLELEMAALKTMTAHGTGRTGGLRERDRAALEPALRPGPVWEGNHLARLLGLLALRREPELRTRVAEAVTRVTAELRPDGGLPFITGMDLFATATAGLALTSAGHGGTERTARMAVALVARQHEDGGFGFTRGVRQSDADDTSYVIEFLRAGAAGTGVHRAASAAAVSAAEDYLARLRNDDGGFPTFARGVASETAMTAGAVNALAPSPRHRRLAEDGVRFLTRPERSAALFERSWSRNITNAVFRTVLACESLTPGAPVELRAEASTLRVRLLRHLRDRQQPDGGWGHEDHGPSDPISTAYAVIALSRTPEHAAQLRAALDYLAREQRPDGGFVSVPDQAGPRPLLYDAPVLADICVLLAWGHALGHVPGKAPGTVPDAVPGHVPG